MSPLVAHDLSVHSLRQLVGLVPLQVFQMTAGGFPTPCRDVVGLCHCLSGISHLLLGFFPTPSRDNVGVATERLGFAAHC